MPIEPVEYKAYEKAKKLDPDNIILVWSPAGQSGFYVAYDGDIHPIVKQCDVSEAIRSTYMDGEHAIPRLAVEASVAQDWVRRLISFGFRVSMVAPANSRVLAREGV